MKTTKLIFAFVIGLFLTTSVIAQSEENQLYYAVKEKVKPDKVDKYIDALEAYGDNIAKYLLASDDNSRPNSLAANKAIANKWNDQVKGQVPIGHGND